MQIVDSFNTAWNECNRTIENKKRLCRAMIDNIWDRYMAFRRSLHNAHTNHQDMGALTHPNRLVFIQP